MFSSRERAALSLLELLLIVLLIGCFLLMLLPVLLQSQFAATGWHCAGNLRQLGSRLELYVGRFGNGRDYPTTEASGGSGAPVPAGANGAFWSWLYRVPDSYEAVVSRPGEDELFRCPLRGGAPTRTALDYTGPRFDATWPAKRGNPVGEAVFPAGRLGSAVRANAMIGGDCLGPPDRPNHGGAPGEPVRSWNTLFFDGHVDTISPASTRHTQYSTQTTGVRTT